MILEFEYTKKEYVEARQNYLLLSGIIKKRDLFILSFLAIIDFAMLITKNINILTVSLGILIPVLCIISSILYFFQPIIFYNKIEKLHNTYHLDFNVQGITFKTQGLSSKIEWNFYEALWENDKFIYLLHSKQMYTLIPKRAFNYPQEIDIFIQMFCENNKRKIYKDFKKQKNYPSFS